MKISVIIPTYKEAKNIANTLTELQHRKSKNPFIHEILIVDGQSNDGIQKIVSEFDGVHCISSEKGRPNQMNVGAEMATGDILYFLHADCIPPQDFDFHIVKAFQNGFKTGCFRMQFDHKHPWMQFISWLTQFSQRACRGGDQSLFVSKALFEEVGGFDERYLIFEDHEIIGKLYKKAEFKVIQKRLISSSRRFQKKGILKLQLLFWAIYFKKWLGASPEELFRFYKNHID